MQLRRFPGGNIKWALPLALLLAAVLALGPSAGSAGTLGDLVFTTAPHTLTAGTASGVITVQLQNSGAPVNAAADTTIQLSTDSPEGAFRAADGTTPLTPPPSVTIPAGSSSADFTYYDEKAGTSKITAMDAAGAAGFGSVEQNETVNAAAATHFSVTAPASATAGTPFSVTVTALDSFDNTDTSYSGTVQFTSSDTKVTTVLPGNYAFQGSDNGTHPFSDGVTLTTTGTQTVSVADGSKTGTSGNIIVGPASLHHFTWNPQPAGTQTAGTAIATTVTAYDQYDNVKTDYNGSTATISGLSNAPNSSASASYGSWLNGANSGPFIDYKTETTSLTVTDGTVTASTTSFNVGPGALGSFDWSDGQPGPTQTAGQTITATVKAYDAYGNAKSDYSAGPSVFSGLSSSIGGCTGPTQPCAPEYPSFSGGSASGFKDFKAESDVAITVTDGSATATSDPFDVGPAPASHFSIPTPATQTAGHSFDVGLTALDPWENVDTNYGSPSGLVSVTFSGPNPNSPNNSHPTYPSTVTFTNGQGTANITLVTAESTTLTATAGSVSGTTPAAFTVLPGDLASFTVDNLKVVGEPSKPARAGHDSTADVKAYDAFGNLKTNYTPTPGQPQLSGDLNDSTTGCGGGSSHPCSAIYSGTGYGVGSFTNGAATATFRPFKAESGRHITVTDTSLSKSGTSPAFTVSPGDLDHFVVGAPSPAPQAGHDSSVQVTAYDAYGNVKDDYTGTPTLSGNLSTSPIGCPGPCAPIYSGTGYGVGTFVGGTATATFRPFVATEPGPPATPTAETNRNVTVSDGPHTGTSPNFSVLPGEPKTLIFFRQPTETCNARVGLTVCNSDSTKSAIINGATGVQVRAVDGFNNNAYNTTVKLAIATGFNPGNTSLKGTTSQPTGSTGIAVFNDLRIEVVGIGYKLVATAPPVGSTAGPMNSNAFTIAQTVTTCSATACSGSATDQPNSNVAVAGTGTNLAGNTLGIALAGNGPAIPAGVCTGWGPAPNYSASYVDVNEVATAEPRPNLTITWTIPKAVASKVPNIPNNQNNGASHYDICLGSVNLQNPFNTPPITGWPTKSGGTAQPRPDPNFGVTFFWGIIPDCPKKGTLVNPCMVSRGKDGSGNLVLTYYVPHPWDPAGWLGGGI